MIHYRFTSLDGTKCQDYVFRTEHVANNFIADYQYAGGHKRFEYEIVKRNITHPEHIIVPAREWVFIRLMDIFQGA